MSSVSLIFQDPGLIVYGVFWLAGLATKDRIDLLQTSDLPLPFKAGRDGEGEGYGFSNLLEGNRL